MKLSEALERGWELMEDGRYRLRYKHTKTGHTCTRTSIKTECSECGEAMLQDCYSHKKGKLPYCSRKCIGKWLGRQKFGRKKVDRYIRKGYWYVRDPSSDSDDLKGWIKEHIKVFLETNGLDSLPEGTIVHHLNGDKLDNRPENLVLMDGKKHLRLHIRYNKIMSELFLDTDFSELILRELCDYFKPEIGE